ncbi:MAG: cobalamin biosynthesis protein CbiA [Candidatus Zixiibacteriota bacterium]
MTDNEITFPGPVFSKHVIIIVGGYGSGKSEISVNLARLLTKTGSGPIAIADLDIVNPYFRSREAAAELEAFGVKCLIPAGEQVHSELPIIIPEIRAAIEAKTGTLILDVGGDDVGARVLSSLADAFTRGEYELLLVLNERRPFTADVTGALKMMADIETACRLQFSGIISNTHLMDDTTAETVMAGLRLAQRVSDQTGLPVRFLSVTKELASLLSGSELQVPVLLLDRALTKPWERKGSTWTDPKLRIDRRCQGL